MALPSTPTWLVTGCSSGLGLVLAQVALRAGHNVIATSRNPSKTHDVVKSITSHSNGRWIPLDVTSSDLTSVVSEATSLFGRIDVLVNNAGYSVLGALEDISDAAARAQFDTNVFGPLALTRAILPGLRAQGGGVIVNVSSIAGLSPMASSGLYAASKHALEAISESLASETAAFGIKVLIIEPGAFRTNFLQGSNAKFEDVSQAYKGGLAEAVLEKYRGADGKQGGDPEKACRYIFDAVVGQGDFKGKEVTRVMLGKDCHGRVREKVEKIRRDLETCENFETDL